MSTVIAYDLVRLFLGPLFLAPRGIDRVDLAILNHIFADDLSPHVGVLPTFWGIRAYRADQVRCLLQHVKGIWAEEGNEESETATEPAIQELAARIAENGRAPPFSSSRKLTTGDKVRRMLAQLWATGLPLGEPAHTGIPQGAIYLNVGQLGLAVPQFFRWLARRPDVTSAIMLHDVIPLEFPHLVRPGQQKQHARMVETAARHADLFIYSTRYARDTVDAALRAVGCMQVPSIVRGLPLPKAYAQALSGPQELVGTRYFLVVSTIEPRKNHALLLRIWARMLARMGKETPHLVVVGALGYDGEAILSALDANPDLRSRVHQISGISSPALASLMLGATGLLSPTFVEGFGLPVLEANTLGVPVIASDISAHREIADAATILLPCDDEAGWELAICGLPDRITSARRPIDDTIMERGYCTDLLASIEAFHLSRRRP